MQCPLGAADTAVTCVISTRREWQRPVRSPHPGPPAAGGGHRSGWADGLRRAAGACARGAAFEQKLSRGDRGQWLPTRPPGDVAIVHSDTAIRPRRHTGATPARVPPELPTATTADHGLAHQAQDGCSTDLCGHGEKVFFPPGPADNDIRLQWRRGDGPGDFPVRRPPRRDER